MVKEKILQKCNNVFVVLKFNMIFTVLADFRFVRRLLRGSVTAEINAKV